VIKELEIIFIGEELINLLYVELTLGL
jgi:hypothetical protein